MKRDPICGREVDPLRARGVAIVGAKRHYFCSLAHKREFLARRHDDWDEPTPLPPVVAPERDGTGPLQVVAHLRQRRGFLAYIVGLLRRFTL
jgi:YHS domain-containing protein